MLEKRSKRGQLRRRARPEPAPVKISYRCPRCGGPHHVDRCDLAA